MSFSASRLTCFALISSLEQDLRSNILRFLVDEDYTATLTETQADRAAKRRGRDTGSRNTASLTALLPYLDFADGYEVLLANRTRLPGDLADQLTKMATSLQRITAV